VTRKKGIDSKDTAVDTNGMRIILPASVIASLKAEGASEVVSGDTGERRILTPHLSFSQIAMYLRCSMQYWFRYIEGLKDKPKVSLAIGKGGHAALEKSVKRKIKTGITNSPDEVVQWASDFMDKEMLAMPFSEYEKDVEPGETKDKFLAATRVFQTRDAPTIRPIAAEVEFNLDLNEFMPEPLETPIRVVNGKIDVLYDDFGKILVPTTGLVRVGVDDYKYVGKKRSQSEVDLSPQLSLYGVVVKKLTGLWPTRLGYTMFTPGNTKDGPDATAISRSPDLMTPTALEARMRRIAYQFRKVEEGIRAGIFIPTDNPITCSWCGYRERCQSSLVTDLEAATLRAQTSPPTE
jgi:hypothetical protein